MLGDHYNEPSSRTCNLNGIKCITDVKHKTILLITVITGGVPLVEAVGVLHGTQRAIHSFALSDGVCGIDRSVGGGGWTAA